MLKLRYYGDPILRKCAEPVEEITDEIRKFVGEMCETVLAYKALGLAAPQVGRLLRIFVSPLFHEDENGELHLGEPKIYINPILSAPSSVLVERGEACLSLPGLEGSVLRPLSITVEATDLLGNRFKEESRGYVARCRMHENDHLNGVLFIDRIKGKRRTLLEPALLKIKQKYHD